MKRLLPCAIACLMMGCSQYQCNLRTMEKAARQHLEDQTFRDNLTLNIIDFRSIKYDTVDENFFDTVQAMMYMDASNKFIRLYNESAGLALQKAYADSAKKYSLLSNKTLWFWKAEPQMLYGYKAFCKATMRSGNGVSTNFLDTLYLYFDEKLNVKPLQSAAE